MVTSLVEVELLREAYMDIEMEILLCYRGLREVGIYDSK